MSRYGIMHEITFLRLKQKLFFSHRWWFVLIHREVEVNGFYWNKSNTTMEAGGTIKRDEISPTETISIDIVQVNRGLGVFLNKKLARVNFLLILHRNFCVSRTHFNWHINSIFIFNFRLSSYNSQPSYHFLLN